jgi:hypothetical protein
VNDGRWKEFERRKMKNQIFEKTEDGQTIYSTQIQVDLK